MIKQSLLSIIIFALLPCRSGPKRCVKCHAAVPCVLLNNTNYYKSDSVKKRTSEQHGIFLFTAIFGIQHGLHETNE